MENHSESVHGSVPKKADNKSNLMIALGAVAVILVVLAFANFGGSMFKGANTVSPDEARTKALDFINKNLVTAGTTAEITSITEYSDSLYKMTVKVGDTSIDSYMTKDAKQFFPQSMDIDAVNNGTVASDGTTTPSAPVVAADIPKNDKPKVELFIMSHCPYGTQIEKGIVPVAKALGDKMDFEIKFVNYIMHDMPELVDNIKQYCIGTEQKDKYNDFLTCYLKAGDAVGCVASSGVDQKKLDKCYAATDKKFNLIANFNDKSKWNGSFPTFAIHDAENKAYGVQGSPTLVVNGKIVESNRDSASLLATVCAAFNNAPEECKATLDSATPAAGFGTGVSNNTNAAECAPAT